MNSGKRYVQVIVPLHLEWEPWYSHEEELRVGQRVVVKVARREYIAVVSSTGGMPDIDPSRILPITRVETELEPILPDEIEFWRFIADYYMCTVGDVYAMVYPPNEVKSEKTTRALKKIDSRTSEDYHPTLGLEGVQKPILICGGGRKDTYEAYIKRCLDSGKDVLFINPRAKRESYPTQRELAKKARSGVPTLIEGSKYLVFLPFTKLGLVIIEQEQSPAYKYNKSPRFNGRDAAVALASLRGAQAILGTDIPSLESLYNVSIGKYTMLESAGKASRKQAGPARLTIVDTDAERHKFGMDGDRSFVLINMEKQAAQEGRKVLEVESWELQKALSQKIEKYGLVAVLHTEHLLSRQDFRSDERAWRMIQELCSRCKGDVVIQTSSASHPVFTSADYLGQLLEERRFCNYPPFTRLVEIRKKKGATEEIVAQHFLKRDASLRSRKDEIKRTTAAGLLIDVDPV